MRLADWGGPEFTILREQTIPGSMSEVYAFFEDPENLGLITPPWMGFRILSMEPDGMCNGAIIRYRITIGGVPMFWKTLISAWEPGDHFVDEQVSGPYAQWIHTHSFRRVENAVEIRDEVRYRMPLGWLGVIIHALFVKRQLRAVFDFREITIANLFVNQADVGKVGG